MNAIGGRAGQALAPTLWQQAVLMIPEGVNIAMLGGRAPGKTTGSLFVALRHAVKYGAAAKVLLIRKTTQSLREIETRLVVMFMSYIPGTTYNGSHHILTCGNGATGELGHLEHDTDFQRYQGREARQNRLVVTTCRSDPDTGQDPSASKTQVQVVHTPRYQAIPA